jgi:hypothetical protein
MFVEMEKWRRNIEPNLPSQNAVPRLGKAIRPWMEKWNSGGASPCGSSFEVFHAPEDFHAFMTKRSTDHSLSGQKNGLEIARRQFAGGGIVEEARRLGTSRHLESKSSHR